jgi:hypothetical protein
MSKHTANAEFFLFKINSLEWLDVAGQHLGVFQGKKIGANPRPPFAVAVFTSKDIHNI